MKPNKNKTTIRKIVLTCLVLFVCILAVVAIHSLFVIAAQQQEEIPQAEQISNTLIPLDHIILAYDTADRERGLSGRAGLPRDTGMLFVFDTPAKYGFWMKDMLFSIDMIWLDEDFRVITVARDISPNSFPQVFYPVKPARYVLEVTSGVADDNHYIEGGRLDFLPHFINTFFSASLRATHLQK